MKRLDSYEVLAITPAEVFARAERDWQELMQEISGHPDALRADIPQPYLPPSPCGPKPGR